MLTHILQYRQVGTYSGTGNSLTLDLQSENIVMLDPNGHITNDLPTSVCEGNCMECAKESKIPLAFLNGSAYIIGIFSIHERSNVNPFQVSKL